VRSVKGRMARIVRNYSAFGKRNQSKRVRPTGKQNVERLASVQLKRLFLVAGALEGRMVALNYRSCASSAFCKQGRRFLGLGTPCVLAITVIVETAARPSQGRRSRNVMTTLALSWSFIDFHFLCCSHE
jgi:hypothetical protein